MTAAPSTLLVGALITLLGLALAALLVRRVIRLRRAAEDPEDQAERALEALSARHEVMTITEVPATDGRPQWRAAFYWRGTTQPTFEGYAPTRIHAIQRCCEAAGWLTATRRPRGPAPTPSAPTRGGAAS